MEQVVNLEAKGLCGTGNWERARVDECTDEVGRVEVVMANK